MGAFKGPWAVHPLEPGLYLFNHPSHQLVWQLRFTNDRTSTYDAVVPPPPLYLHPPLVVDRANAPTTGGGMSKISEMRQTGGGVKCALSTVGCQRQGGVNDKGGYGRGQRVHHRSLICATRVRTTARPPRFCSFFEDFVVVLIAMPASRAHFFNC
jgi:hypothetical protein